MINLRIIKKEYLDKFNEFISETYSKAPMSLKKIETDPTKAEDAAYQEEIKKSRKKRKKKHKMKMHLMKKLKKK